MDAPFIALYVVLLVGAFGFLVVRPQRRQVAAHRAFVASLEVDDEVITAGGIIGTIRALTDDVVELEVAPNVVVKVARGAIAHHRHHGATDAAAAPGNGAAA